MANKSKLYQHKIVEISFDASKLNNFPMERGINQILSDNSSNERIVELQDELLDELHNIIHNGYLTDHQRKILMMRMMGKTQNEIATHLGITQSAVHKAMHGNIDYRNNKKRYGGVVKKLQKICTNNDRIKQILKEIEQIKKTVEQD